MQDWNERRGVAQRIWFAFAFTHNGQRAMVTEYGDWQIDAAKNLVFRTFHIRLPESNETIRCLFAVSFEGEPVTYWHTMQPPLATV